MTRLKQLADEMDKNHHFETIAEFERPFGADEFEDLQSMIEEAGIEQLNIWDEFKRFYSATNGFLFQWTYHGDQQVKIDTASTEISPLQAIYLPEHLRGEKLQQFYGQRRAFDSISSVDEVDLVFEAGTAAPKLRYFCDKAGTFYPLRLTFEEYLVTLLEARAMYG